MDEKSLNPAQASKLTKNLDELKSNLKDCNLCRVNINKKVYVQGGIFQHSLLNSALFYAKSNLYLINLISFKVLEGKDTTFRE